MGAPAQSPLHSQAAPLEEPGALHNQALHDLASRHPLRWYRAPELLLGAAACEGADRWAAGALLPELLTGAPLLPGSTDLEQLARITALLGPPDECESATLPKLPGFSLSSTTQRASLREALPDADADALALCLRLLRWVPSDRLRPVEALAHRWFFSLPLPYTRRQVVELCNDGKS